MARNMQNLFINEISQATKNWRVKVVLLDKTKVHTSPNNRRTQKLLLQDAQGNTVEAIMWDETIDQIDARLTRACTYTVGGAQVQQIKPAFQYMSPGMAYEWVFTAATFIRQITDPAEMIAYPALQSFPLCDTPALAGTKTPIDIIAVMVDIKTPREVVANGKLTPIQEIVLVDEHLYTTMLTMWGDYVESPGQQLYESRHNMPIIVCRKVTVAKFSGGTLSTVPFCYITIDPDLPQVHQLRNWVTNNVDAIQQAPTMTTYSSNAQQKNRAAEMKQKSPQQPQHKVRHVTGAVTISDIQQDIHYCNCPKCSQLTTAAANEEFHCNVCNSDEIAVPRCKVIIELQQAAEKIAATMYDQNAEKLLGHTATKLHEKNPQEIQHLLSEVNTQMKQKRISAELQPSTKQYADQKTRFTVYQWTEAESTTKSTSDPFKDTPEISGTPEKQEGKRSSGTPEGKKEDTSTKKAGIHSYCLKPNDQIRAPPELAARLYRGSV